MTLFILFFKVHIWNNNKHDKVFKSYHCIENRICIRTVFSCISKVEKELCVTLANFMLICSVKDVDLSSISTWRSSDPSN